MTRPYTLIAELTYACALHGGYCSNPLDLRSRAAELSTPAWGRVFAEAHAQGVTQVTMTGGEPLLRPDLEELGAAGRPHGPHVPPVTPGVPLAPGRLARLGEAGLDAGQLSVQAADPTLADGIAGRPS